MIRRLRPRRGRAATPRFFDEAVWATLQATVEAAQDANRDEFFDRNHRLMTVFSREQQDLAYLYMYVCLHLRLVELVGTNPSEADLVALSQKVRADYVSLLPADGDCLLQAMRACFQRSGSHAFMSWDQFTVRAAVALGVLLRRQPREFRDYRERVEQWCLREEADIPVVLAEKRR